MLLLTTTLSSCSNAFQSYHFECAGSDAYVSLHRKLGLWLVSSDVYVETICSGLVASVERLSQRGILKLTKEKILLICAGESNTSGGPQVWAQINVRSVFSDFRIESNINNEIDLEFVPLTLSKALKSSFSSDNIEGVVKLAKKQETNQPILSFEFSGVSRQGHSEKIVQEVHVRVLKPGEMEEMAKEPMCPDPDVHIMLPLPCDTMRGVVERMKLLGSVIQVSANQQGMLRLKVSSDEATAETEWKGLKHPEMENKDEEDGSQSSTQQQDLVDPSVFHSVSIETKHLLKLFGALQNGTHTIACEPNNINTDVEHDLDATWCLQPGICAGHCSIYYVYIGSNDASDAENAGILTFFVPGHSEGE